MGNETSSLKENNELILNNLEFSWEKLVFDEVRPRDGHCACSCSGKLYIFGGVIHNKNDFHETNDLLVFDPVNRTCEPIKGNGDVPVSRSSAILASVDYNLYLFGGLNADQGWLNDLHVFNIVDQTWQKCDAPNAPSPRDKMSCVVIDSEIYVFGGFGPFCQVQVENALNNDRDDEEGDEDDDDDDDPDNDLSNEESAKFGWFDELYIYNTKLKLWTQPVQLNLQCPSPRAAHCMSAIADQIVIFGGRDKHGRNNDLHIFDIVKKKWISNVNISGKCPEPRSFHASVAVGDRLLICGGRSSSDEHFSDAHVFDSKTLQWLQPSIKLNNNYTNRGVHTMNVVDDYIVMFGGSSDFNNETNQCNIFYNDFYILPKEQISNGGALNIVGGDQMNSSDNKVKNDEIIENKESNIINSST